MTGYIVGWAHTPFGKLAEPDIETLIARVAIVAVEDAGLTPNAIDAIFIGVFNNGFAEQDFPSSLALQVDPRFRFKPAVRIENACATGTAAIHAGLNYLGSGRGHRVLVIGAEKMTATPVATVGDILLGASYRREEANRQGGFPGVFSRIAEAYFQMHGDQSDAMALIAAKNHKNGVSNPFAQIRKDLGYEFCRVISERNPVVAAPLRRTDCSPISDGAAALVLADAEAARAAEKAVRFRSVSHVNDYLPLSRRDPTFFEGAATAWKEALDAAHVSLDDLSFVETHDCFTIAELMEYEAMGLAERGRGAWAIKDGWTERTGRLPINPSGGLKAKGHPIGATGVSMHVLAAMQLTGKAPDGLQLPSPQIAGIFNMGGAAVANYVSVLEAYR